MTSDSGRGGDEAGAGEWRSEDRGDRGAGTAAAGQHRLTGPVVLAKRRTNPLLLAAALFAAMLSYYFFIAWRGFYLIMEDRWLLRALGVAVLAAPLIGFLTAYAQLSFAVACQLLARSMPDAGEEPLESPAVPRLPSGRKDRRTADAWLDQQREAARQAPQDWRAWFRLAQAHHLTGDRKGAREAMRTAIDKHKQR